MTRDLRILTFSEPLSLEDKAAFIYHSNTIERVPFSFETTLSILQGKMEGDVQYPGYMDAGGQDQFTTALVTDHARALDTVLGFPQEDRITEGVVKRLHRQLWKDSDERWMDRNPPGQYRDAPRSVGGRECPFPPFVPHHMKRLIERIRDVETEGHADPASLFALHLDYEHIHPFYDGNGRSGRLLWALLSRRAGLPLPMIDAGLDMRDDKNIGSYYHAIDSHYPAFREAYHKDSYDDLALAHLCELLIYGSGKLKGNGSPKLVYAPAQAGPAPVASPL